MNTHGTDPFHGDEIAERARLKQEMDEALGDEDIEPLALHELPVDDREALALVLRRQSLQAEFDKKHPILSYLSSLPVLGTYFQRMQTEYVEDRLQPAVDRDPFGR